MKKITFIFYALILTYSSYVKCQVSSNEDTTSFSYYINLANNQIGKQAINWSLIDLTGKTHNLSDYSGELLLIEFWGTGCGSCVMAARDVCEIDSTYKTKGLVVIGIEGDGRSNLEQIKDFKQKYNLNYLTLINGMNLKKEYGFKAFPTFYLIDKNGIIQYAHVGRFYGDAKKRLIELIENNLQ